MFQNVVTAELGPALTERRGHLLRDGLLGDGRESQIST